MESSRIASEAKLLKEEQVKQNLVALNPSMDDQLKKDPSQSNTLNLKVKKDCKSKPKSFLEMEKNLGALTSSEEKFMYLTNVGLDRVEMLQRAGCTADVEFLEMVLKVFVEMQQSFSDVEFVLRYLKIIFSSVHCKLMFSFADPALKTAVSEMLHSISSHTTTASDVIEQFEKLNI
mmetsp:Transcript_4911/g.6765  ORF Transcript_4911/g.6765 Transcript_4911/m.6765 type:complete len:176 (-) Transcript_4911:85-612(-)